MILNQMCPNCSYLIHALLSQNQVCRDYALFGGHFWPKFGGRGHRNILKDQALNSTWPFYYIRSHLNAHWCTWPPKNLMFLGGHLMPQKRRKSQSINNLFLLCGGLNFTCSQLSWSLFIWKTCFPSFTDIFCAILVLMKA